MTEHTTETQKAFLEFLNNNDTAEYGGMSAKTLAGLFEEKPYYRGGFNMNEKRHKNFSTIMRMLCGKMDKKISKEERYEEFKIHHALCLAFLEFICIPLDVSNMYYTCLNREHCDMYFERKCAGWFAKNKDGEFEFKSGRRTSRAKKNPAASNKRKLEVDETEDVEYEKALAEFKRAKQAHRNRQKSKESTKEVDETDSARGTPRAKKNPSNNDDESKEIESDAHGSEIPPPIMLVHGSNNSTKLGDLVDADLTSMFGQAEVNTVGQNNSTKLGDLVDADLTSMFGQAEVQKMADDETKAYPTEAQQMASLQRILDSMK